MSGHAIQRAHERYGVQLTRDDVRAIEASVRFGYAPRLPYAHSPGSSVFLVTSGDGVRLPVVVDAAGKLVTVLPVDALPLGAPLMP